MRAQGQIKPALSQLLARHRVVAVRAGELEAHRTALADQLCAAFGFVDAEGRAQRSGCLKALRGLEREGRITLPAPRTARGERRPRRLGRALAPAHDVPGALGQPWGSCSCESSMGGSA